MSNVAIIGNGNVGHHFAKQISVSHKVSVFSRSKKEGVRSFNEFNPSKYDFAVLTIPDDAIFKTANSIEASDCMIAHTSGSRPLSDLAKHQRSGVIYPFQTFSKEKEIDFNSFPVFIEADEMDCNGLESFVKTFCPDVRFLNSSQRAKIHLAAVFACNFTNHMYSISDSLLSTIGMSFSDLEHLAKETLDKASSMSPVEAQTGPAIRNDSKTISSHLSLIESEELKQIYELISKNIRKVQ